MNDDILNQLVKCSDSGKPFQVIPQELAFYRKQNLPLPRLHPDVRHAHRFRKRNPRQLWTRTCAASNAAILTTYSPNSPEIVYSESAYEASL
ncbi:hypothetical protein OAO01_00485 [Oligoflexia bacterium]|nr:hypothetical protein [Oligoflexia bacterium]